ncbi:membrane protein [Caldovatus sediminis]|uniref:Membrane protein n=1 Tax=Caldovatus sediminis TaxID=2041189 RepID=A0A8J2ZDX0_9PROT|nr:sulfite exporter TauE/SafE family protein [Caldovatus sediminis]GGG43676.1 membrane protein [Caldovatus sediminis]
MLASCLHDLSLLGPGGVAAMAGALFLAGLAGGATHCVGMCAPFVLAQAAATADRAASGGTLRRLAGAALLPYQAGRMLGYGALGALAGGAAGLATQASGVRYLLAALLAVAAILMLGQASARLAAWLPRLPAPRLPAGIERRLAPLLAAPTGWRGVALGLMLSALPCGLLYGALAAAAASGSALGGAIGMVAFVLGTVPALGGVALLGRLFGRSGIGGPALRAAGAALFTLNGLVLAGMAVRVAALA